MSVYTIAYKMRSADVDMHRRLRLSVLFTMLQEAAIAHTEQLGAGRDKTLARGLLWVVTLQNVEICRLPEYDETVTLTSWAGKTMHLYFPRYSELRDESGQILIRASALWALMDRNTRRIVFPEEHSVSIEGTCIGTELPLPAAPRMGALDRETAFTVPFSYADLNGHMNNTRYLDLVQDTLPLALTEQTPRKITVGYSGEARVGERMTLCYGKTGGTYCILGQTERRLFRMRLEYGGESG